MASVGIAEMRKAHQVLAEFNYDPVELQRGYTNRTLRFDISKNTIEEQAVTQQMKDLWIGGKGFDLWLMLQEISSQTKWDSPENPICMSSGPLGGTTSFPGSGKTIVTAISPLTQSIMDSNVGGYFGPYLKFSGYDALTIVGKATEDIIIFIDSVDHKITIEKAPEESLDSHKIAEELTEMYADDEMDKRNISVVSAGQASEHIRMGILNFSFWDWRRGEVRLKQAGRGGIGTVFRNKNIKALIIKNKEYLQPWSIAENKVTHLTTDNICCEEGKSDRELVNEIVEQWNTDPDYVIEMMQDVQEKERFISKTALQEISLRTAVPESQLYHIATFYKAFSLKPRGELNIQVCIGTACHVKGAAKILDSFERELDIKQGETTKDERFSLEAIACLGTCSIAPVVKVGDEIIGNVMSKDVPKLIKKALKLLETNKQKGDKNA
jgi:NADH:ubiquinone oxidoreductase subunit E